MLVYKTSLLMQVITAPADRVYANAHAGGWSEGFWAAFQPLPGNAGSIGRWANARALMLPTQMSIVGYRITVYDLANNKLTPAGTSAGKLIIPGSGFWSAGNPQAGLELGFPALAGPNSSRIVLRGLPDEVIVNGEFSGNPLFRQSLTGYMNVVTNNGWGWVGRDLTQPSAVVNQIAGNVVTLSAVLAGTAVGDFLRFRKCRNDA